MTGPVTEGDFFAAPASSDGTLAFVPFTTIGTGDSPIIIERERSRQFRTGVAWARRHCVLDFAPRTT